MTIGLDNVFENGFLPESAKKAIQRDMDCKEEAETACSHLIVLTDCNKDTLPANPNLYTKDKGGTIDLTKPNYI